MFPQFQIVSNSILAYVSLTAKQNVIFHRVTSREREREREKKSLISYLDTLSKHGVGGGEGKGMRERDNGGEKERDKGTK